MPQAQQYQPSQPFQQPQSPPPVRPGFSMHDLVSEEALPEWLRQASAESAQPTQRQPVPGPNPYSPPPTYPAAYSSGNQPTTPAYGGGLAPVPADEPPPAWPDASAFPPLESAGSYQPPQTGGGMPASSLLDPNALPSWLSGQQGHAPSDGLRGGDGMRAQSLVDETALPGWLRAEPASSPAQAPAAPPPPASASPWGAYPAQPAAPAPAPAPAWGNYPAAPVAPAAPAVPYGGYAGMQPPVPANGANGANGQQGFSASSLIDPNALPDWMRAQGGAGMPQPGMPHPGMPGMPAPAPAAAQGQWSASDLIDQAMLPAWVRESEAAPPLAMGANNPNPISGMGQMPLGIDAEATRERTSRVAAPRPPLRDQADRDFSASRPASPRGNPSARPLDDYEKPAWLRENPRDDYGRESMYDRENMGAYPPPPPPPRQERQDRNSRSWNGYNDQDDYGAQSSRYSRASQRVRTPGGQTGQSWAAPDRYESSPWSRPRPPRFDESAPPKKRWNDFFRFLRRG